MIEKKGQALVVARSRRFRGNKIPTVDVKQFHIADRNALNVCWSNEMTTKKLLGLLLASLQKQRCQEPLFEFGHGDHVCKQRQRRLTTKPSVAKRTLGNRFPAHARTPTGNAVKHI